MFVLIIAREITGLGALRNMGWHVDMSRDVLAVNS